MPVWANHHHNRQKKKTKEETLRQKNNHASRRKEPETGKLSQHSPSPPCSLCKQASSLSTRLLSLPLIPQDRKWSLDCQASLGRSCCLSRLARKTSGPISRVRIWRSQLRSGVHRGPVSYNHGDVVTYFTPDSSGLAAVNWGDSHRKGGWRCMITGLWIG